MKLSAPPPPPPEPPEPGPAPEPQPEPEKPTAAADAATAPTPAVQPAPVAKPATWPAWFGGLDAALVVFAVALGFIAASFAARNSDLWVHLAAGRMLTTGEYKLGSDPLSYTAADRTWVNHSWLFDLGAYLLYKGNGFILVLAKAIAVAVAVGLLIGIRRPGQPLWPWALLAGMAAVAALPYLTLSPLVASAVCLAITLFLVFRLDSPPGSWRLPIGIGITFWFWANLDAWFILGPATLALLLVGEVVRQKTATSSDPPPDESFGRLPDVPTLAKALGIGVLACMLNPHHVRVWDLPFELLGSDAARADPSLRVALLSPLGEGFWSDDRLGHNTNGLAYFLLLAAGVYAVGLSGVVGRMLGPPADVEPMPLPHAVVWCGFAALSLVSAYAIPFLAVVTVPLVAFRLNAFSARVELADWNDRRTRMFLATSGAGRVLTAILFLVLGTIAYPGWLQPPGWKSPAGWDAAQARRMVWTVEPDPALVRAAEQFKRWRESAHLPAGTTGIIASVDLANYCAWYAPGEKVFLNGRLAHHRPEQPEFVSIRTGLRLLPHVEAPDPKEQERIGEERRKIMTSRGAAYVAISTSATESAEARDRASRTSVDLWRAWSRWAAWYLDGRTAVFGWRESTEATAPTFEALRVDTVAQAFGPRVERVPAGTTTPLPVPREWLDDFLRPVTQTPPDAAEALAWIRYKEAVGRRLGDVHQIRALLLRNVTGVAAPPFAGIGFQMEAELSYRNGARPFIPPPDGSFRAIPILALRAARRAIAANPDHPDGYFALSQVLADTDLPISEGERAIGIVCALRQCLYRLPKPEAFRREVYIASPTHVAATLAGLYLGPQLQNGAFQGSRVDLPIVGDLVGEVLVARRNQLDRVPVRQLQNMPADVRLIDGTPRLLALDLAHETLVKAMDYAAVEFTAEAREGILKELGEGRKQLDAALKRPVELYRAQSERQPKLRDRYVFARQSGLIGEAIGLLHDKDADLGKEFGPDAPWIALELIALEFAVGRLEEVDADIVGLKEGFEKMSADPRRPGDPRVALRHLEFQKMILEGNYGAAGEEFERLQGQGVGAELPPDFQQFERRPYVHFGNAWPVVTLLGATDGPFGVLGRYVMTEFQRSHFVGRRNAIVTQMQNDAQFFFRRGLLSLLEGDIEAAAVRFRQTRRTPPPGWGLQNVRHQQAEAYLQMIETADKNQRP